MSWPTAVVTELVQMIEDQWPEVSVIFRTEEMSVQSWENLVRQGLAGQGQLVPPFVVLSLGKALDWPEYNPIEGGMHRLPGIVWYVAMRNDQQPRQVEGLEEYGASFAGRLLGQANNFAVPMDPTTDASEGNAANQVFMGQGNHPLLAVAVQFDLLAGVIGGRV